MSITIPSSSLVSQAPSFVSKTSQIGSPLTGKGLIRGGPLVAGVEVSVLLSESHNMAASATKLSLESGTQVTDHIIVDPADVTIVFEMSNVGGGADTARDVFETFKTLLESRELLELTTEHHVYKDMVILGVSPVHQAPYKGALNISVNLQQINFVRLQQVGRVNTKAGTATSKTADPATDAGQQDAEDDRSLLQKIQDLAVSNL